MIKLLRKYRKNQQGTVVVFLAVSVFTLIIAVGIAVDMSRAQLVRSKLISAVDAATLSAGAVSNAQADQIEAIVYNYFNANMPNNYMGVEVPSLVITVEDSDGAVLDLTSLRPGDDIGSIRVQADGTVETTFMRLAGIDTVPISTEAEVEFDLGAGPTLEIALVMDNSCSMGVNGGGSLTPCNSNTVRLDNLKTTVNNFLDIMLADDPDNVRVALIPFETHVNQESGTALPPAPVRNNGGGRAGDGNFSIPDNGVYAGHPNNDTFWANGDYHLWVGYCFNNSNIIPSDHSTYPPSATSPGGCPAGYTVNSLPCVTPSSGDIYDCLQHYRRNNLATITSFGQNRASLQARVNAMQASGQTNTALGSQYGLWALDPNRTGLFRHNEPPGNFNTAGFIKNVVILTDGTNEVCSSLAKPPPIENDCTALVAQRNAEQTAVCNQMRAQGVNVFTVTFALGSSTSEEQQQKAIFQNCATEPEYYFDAGNGAALADAFLEIADVIRRQSVRLSR